MPFFQQHLQETSLRLPVYGCYWRFFERFGKKMHGIASQNGDSGNLPFIVLHIFILRKKDFLLIEKRFLWDSIYTGLRSNSRC